eukprot:m.104363 g.104363  ORF g.104363 m.104363 type:complete len:56 (+) comp37203_c0_seq15:1505-1672(+)
METSEEARVVRSCEKSCKECNLPAFLHELQVGNSLLSAGAYSSQQQENGGLTKCI